MSKIHPILTAKVEFPDVQGLYPWLDPIVSRSHPHPPRPVATLYLKSWMSQWRSLRIGGSTTSLLVKLDFGERFNHIR